MDIRKELLKKYENETLDMVNEYQNFDTLVIDVVIEVRINRVIQIDLLEFWLNNHRENEPIDTIEQVLEGFINYNNFSSIELDTDDTTEIKELELNQLFKASE